MVTGCCHRLCCPCLSVPVADARQKDCEEPQGSADAAAQPPLRWGLRRRSRQARVAASPAKPRAADPVRDGPMAGALPDAAPQLPDDFALPEQVQGVSGLQQPAVVPPEAQTQVCSEWSHAACRVNCYVKRCLKMHLDRTRRNHIPHRA